MKTCKNCAHFDACANFWFSDYDFTNSIVETKRKHANQKTCRSFKDRKLIFETPCKAGTVVYGIHEICTEEGVETKEVFEGKLISFSIDENSENFCVRYECGLTYWHRLSDFGKTVFLSKEEAENELQKQKMKTKEKTK